VGKEKLKSFCRYDKDLNAWALKQPCLSMMKSMPDLQDKASHAPISLHPPLKEMPYNLAVDAFCPAAREFAKRTMEWWIICENNWANILRKLTQDQK
jgi:hypothetical protein